MGATPSAQGGCSLWWGGACSVGPTSVHHSTMISCFFGVLGFLCKRSCLGSSLLLPLQAFSLPTAVPSLGPHSKPHSPAPFCPPQQETHYSDGHAQGGDTDHECCSYIVQLPQTICCIPFNPLQVSLYPI